MHVDLARLRAELCKRREFWPACHAILRWLHRHEHWAHTHLHTLYFGFVAFEAHGNYGKIAGLLFVISVLGAISGEPVE